MAARSSPPTPASTPITSFLSGRCSASDCRSTSFFRRKPSSVSPPPRPVTAATSAPVRAASTADEVVVLPMPISPMPSAVTPSALASAACSIPAAMASSTCRRVMASSRTMLPVPRRTFRSRMPTGGTSPSMPTSTTVTSSPKAAAIADIPVLRKVMFTACCNVTDGGVQDTPSATTPLSAANTATRHLSMAGHTCPVTPASRMDSSSSCPRLPGGLASCACRRRAASMAASSAGRMASIYARSSCSVMLTPPDIPAAPASRETARSPDFRW